MPELIDQKTDHTQHPSQQETPHKQKKHISRTFILIGLLFIGTSLGLIIFISNSSRNAIPKQKIDAALNQKKMFLTITSPKESTVSVNDEVLVSGRTLPNVTVAIYSDIDETLVDSDNLGNFESTVVVDQSNGLLRVTAFSPSGDEKTQTVQLAQNMVLGESDVKNDKANGTTEKHENNGNQNTLTENTNKNKLEKQTNVKQNAQVTETTPTVVKGKDKQINDFITNKKTDTSLQKLGGLKIKDVLKDGTESGKLHLSNTLKIEKMTAKAATNGAQLKRHAVSGVITSVSGNVITLTHQIKGDLMFTVYYNADTVIHSKGEKSGDASASAEVVNTAILAAGMRIAAVGTLVDNVILAKRIHIIPGKATGVFNKQPEASPSGMLDVTPSLTASPTAIPATLIPTETLSPTLTTTP
jgi:hypothetical protein